MRRRCRQRRRGHWHLLQTRYGFDRWKLTWISPFLGVCETHRLVGRTLMVLGQAAGTAAALCHGELSALDADALRRTLQSDGVALDLPSGYLDAMADIAPLPDRDFAPGQPYEIDA